MAAPLGRDTLPDHWSYGVCRDGRVFFINDKTRGTTWLHPRTGEPVNSGHMIRSDLPRGWEEGFTEEGASYFINHNQRTTTFRHPVTGHISSENTDFLLQDQANLRMSKPPPELRPPSMVSESSVAISSSPADTTSGSRNLKPSGKVHCFGKRDHSIKRNPNVPVVVRGWLYKQDSSGMRLWKRKWFVLSDYCLFYYKDSREETVLGSIPLPSYVVSPVGPEDHISRKYTFKACHTGMRSYIYNKNSLIGSQAEHCGMRTYFFSADTQEDMNGWIRAMNQSALMQSHGVKREAERSSKLEQHAVPQTNHFSSSIKSSSQTEGLQQTLHVEVAELRPERDGDECYVYSKEVLEDSVKTISPGEMEGLSQSGAHSRPSSTVPSHRNGLPSSGMPPDQNGNVVYKRGLVPRTDTEKKVQRKTALAQVEHWVKVQKGDPKSHPTAEYTLPRRTPPLQPKSVMMDTYQSLPKTTRHHSGGSSPPVPRNLPSDYKYAHDRLSHFRMSTDERMATKEGMVWQLYEWQQRQQFRHGSPTAPIYTGPDYMDTSGFRVTLEMPRSISVPPSPCDMTPTGHPSRSLSPRRPHTPSDRVTVRPLDDLATVDTPSLGSPRGICSQISKTSQIERRSMPMMGYITHTVSAPSLHGKTPEELTLLLIQLRRHQAKMASVHSDTFTHLQNQHNGLSGPILQADDTYIQLKKDLEYLDLKVTGRDSLKDRPPRPVKIAESDIDVKLSRLCEQDKILQELEASIRTLKEDKDKLESVLDVSHQQMEQYQDQPAHAEKIAYQQKLLREDVVHIRADISQVSTEMENAWAEYNHLERDVDRLRSVLQDQMTHSALSQQEKSQLRKELWRIEDVLAGLSSSKANYRVTIDSVRNPGESGPLPAITPMHWSTDRERKLVPSASLSAVPSLFTPSMGELKAAQSSPHLSPVQSTQQPLQLSNPAHKQQWLEEDAPPRPPLPHLYSPDEHPPAVPPLPKETSVIRHTSVRGLKRQSDERKRDREIGQYTNGDHKVEIRAFLSEPELLAVGGQMGGLSRDSGYQTLPNRGLTSSSSRLNQSSNISSFVTIRRGLTTTSLKERPKSALERLYSGEIVQQRGRMSAEEQLERMKRHQKALVRERKRTLSQGERQASTSRSSSSSSASRPVSADLGSWRREQDFDLQLLERAVQGEERPVEHKERQRSHSDEWLTLSSTPMRELDLEPLDYQLDLSKELSKPQKVAIPERYVDMDPEEPLSPQEMEARHRKVERIKSILAKSSVQNIPPPAAVDKPVLPDIDSALQEQERIITMSYALASEASLKSKQVAASPPVNSPTSLPQPPPPPPLPPPTPAAVSTAQSAPPPLSNGFHYTFV
ncbi:pleckstrin homology domain-containing family A member 7 isoform X1 [Rhinichthys klamathensis goyatoka]|uniref:pleckstrin homology domain-containing family A member 7 isoform X1 n=4 Tax=Rhinichthys klamathensis goyatoka TaxID=3034132 RepID=UPI0024B4B189|nr:pleckstrin homology domain-containing family A member 7 isoform X1 [Rhinichthys klamathensis goyatoka]